VLLISSTSIHEVVGEVGGWIGPSSYSPLDTNLAKIAARTIFSCVIIYFTKHFSELSELGTKKLDSYWSIWDNRRKRLMCI